MRGTRGPMKKLLFAMAIGAALAWMFDPDAGSRRRDSIRRKLDEVGLDADARPLISSRPHRRSMTPPP